MDLLMDADDIRAFLERSFPQALRMGFEITRVDRDGVSLRLEVQDRHLRPGGTVMGPVLMTLADTASYFAILSRVGTGPHAVTASQETHFLKRPPHAPLVTTARLAKMGRRTAVAAVEIHSEGVKGAVAIATVTYAIVPRVA